STFEGVFDNSCVVIAEFHDLGIGGHVALLYVLQNGDVDGLFFFEFEYGGSRHDVAPTLAVFGPCDGNDGHNSRREKEQYTEDVSGFYSEDGDEEEQKKQACPKIDDSKCPPGEIFGKSGSV